MRARKLWLRLFFCVFLMSILPPLSVPQQVAVAVDDPTVWYVSTSGSDNSSNPHNAATPYRTIAKASTYVTAGDTILIKPGVYTETIEPAHSGSSGSYITYRGDGELGSVVISNTASGAMGFKITSTNPYNYIRLENLKFAGNYRRGISISGIVADDPPSDDDLSLVLHDYQIINCSVMDNGFGGTGQYRSWISGVMLENVERVYIERLQVINNYNSGMGILTSKNVVVKNSSFNSNNMNGESDPSLTDDSDGLDIQNSYNILVDGVEAVGNGEDGIDVGGLDYRYLYTYQVIIRNSTVSQNPRAGFAVSGEPVGGNYSGNSETSNISFINNFSYMNGSAGFEVYDGAKHIRMVNNTVYNQAGTPDRWGSGCTGGDCNIGWNSYGDSTDWTLMNDIGAYNAQEEVKVDDPPQNANIKGYHNLWKEAVPDSPYDDPYSGDTVADPSFRDRTNSNFSLTSSSPAIDEGLTLAKAPNSGSNSTVIVLDNYPYWFSDGFDVASGDLIRVGSSEVTIQDINYGSKTITLTTPITWSANAKVSFPYTGDAPDLGAFEYGEAFIEQAGKLTIEVESAAENSSFAYITNRSSQTWSPKFTGSSGKYMAAEPDTSNNHTNTGNLNNESPEMTFKAHFATGGTYNVWVLAYAQMEGLGQDGQDDSVHFGMDGSYSYTQTGLQRGSWAWKTLGQITVSANTDHDLNIWAREDGSRIDKLYLTTGSDTPSGVGPVQSPRQPKP